MNDFSSPPDADAPPVVSASFTVAAPPVVSTPSPAPAEPAPAQARGRGSSAPPAPTGTPATAAPTVTSAPPGTAAPNTPPPARPAAPAAGAASTTTATTAQPKAAAATAPAGFKAEESPLYKMLMDLYNNNPAMRTSMPDFETKARNIAAGFQRTFEVLGSIFPGLAPVAKALQNMCLGALGAMGGQGGKNPPAPVTPAQVTATLQTLGNFADKVQEAFKSVKDNPTPENLTKALQQLADQTFQFKTPAEKQKFMDDVKKAVDGAAATEGGLTQDKIVQVTKAITDAATEAKLLVKQATPAMAAAPAPAAGGPGGPVQQTPVASTQGAGRGDGIAPNAPPPRPIPSQAERVQHAIVFKGAVETALDKLSNNGAFLTPDSVKATLREVSERHLDLNPDVAQDYYAKINYAVDQAAANGLDKGDMQAISRGVMKAVGEGAGMDGHVFSGLRFKDSAPALALGGKLNPQEFGYTRMMNQFPLKDPIAVKALMGNDAKMEIVEVQDGHFGDTGEVTAEQLRAMLGDTVGMRLVKTNTPGETPTRVAVELFNPRLGSNGPTVHAFINQVPNETVKELRADAVQELPSAQLQELQRRADAARNAIEQNSDAAMPTQSAGPPVRP